MSRAYHGHLPEPRELQPIGALPPVVNRDLAALLALTLLSSCAPPRPPAREPLAEAPESSARQTPAPTEAPTAAPPRVPASTADCPFHWTPQDIGASVVRIPKEVAGRFMNPLFDAACACVRPGERIQIRAIIFPERGAIEAATVERADPETKADPSVDACFATVLGPAAFEPFEVGSDVVCPEQTPPPPPKTKGPPFFRPPRLVGCPEKGQQTSRIMYPLLVDRTGG